MLPLGGSRQSGVLVVVVGGTMDGCVWGSLLMLMKTLNPELQAGEAGLPVEKLDFSWCICNANRCLALFISFCTGRRHTLDIGRGHVMHPPGKRVLPYAHAHTQTCICTMSKNGIIHVPNKYSGASGKMG